MMKFVACLFEFGVLYQWFTVENVDDNTFVISENKHWEETHCYLLCGEKSALLIDTGLGVADIKKVVEQLTKLPICVVTTHVHWDHIGGHKYFDNIAVYESEKSWLAEKFPLPLAVVKQNLTCEQCEFPKDFDVNSYEIFRGEPKMTLHDGQILDLGNRKIQVIHTPGHSPGHCCFYDLGNKYLFSGDLIYKGCLDAYYPTTDVLDFWKSIQKVENLSINRILPAHHSLNISTEIIRKIDDAFAALLKQGELKRGGIFDFGEFQLHI